jgi:hypothetical protein
LYAFRVLNTFKAMVVDGDVLEKEDLYILDRMRAFVSSEEAAHFAAAKQLIILIERAVCPTNTFHISIKFTLYDSSKGVAIV